MRLRRLQRAQYNEQQQEFVESIARSPRGDSAGMSGPFGVWLHSPEFGMRVQEFGAHVRYGTSLPARVSELAILICARHWMAQYEWSIHAPIALKAGVAPEVVEAIRIGARPAFADDRDNSLYRFCVELLAERAITDEVYRKAQAAFGEPALVELVGVLGYYTLIALTLIAFHVDVDDETSCGRME